MENSALERLIAAADGGNRVAERLLLNHLLASKSTDGIAQLLARKAEREGGVDARFLQAELACFHQYPCEEGWAGALQACCRAGHKQALMVASVYHGWSGNHEAAAAIGRLIGGEKIPPGDMGILWVEGWSSWTPPTWRVVAEQDGVNVTRSTTFATRALIGLLRSMLTPLLRPAAVVDPASGKTIAHPVRINRVAQWLPEHLGWVGKLFECRLADAAGYPVENGEVLSLLHYQAGHRYKAHFDCLDSNHAASEAGRREGGQRTTTVLFAMGNDDVVGGETRFPRLNTSVKGATGEIVRFNNTSPAGQPLPASLHEGMLVESGEKWLLSKWVRESATPYGREIALQRPGSGDK